MKAHLWERQGKTYSILFSHWDRNLGMMTAMTQVPLSPWLARFSRMERVNYI